MAIVCIFLLQLFLWQIPMITFANLGQKSIGRLKFPKFSKKDKKRAIVDGQHWPSIFYISVKARYSKNYFALFVISKFKCPHFQLFLFNPIRHEGWYLIISPYHFWIRFCQLIFYQNFPNFLKVTIDINRVILTPNP